MRTTSFCKAAVLAVYLCCAWAGAYAQVSQSSKDVAIDENAPAQDLGVSEVEGDDYMPTRDAGYTEIESSAWEGKALTAADLLSSLPGIQAYKQGGMGSFQTVSIRGIAALRLRVE